MIALIGPIIELVVRLLTFFLDKKAQTEQDRRDYIAFLEIMDRFGIASVKSRLEAVNQIDRVKEMWEKEAEEQKSGKREDQL